MAALSSLSIVPRADDVLMCGTPDSANLGWILLYRPPGSWGSHRVGVWEEEKQAPAPWIRRSHSTMAWPGSGPPLLPLWKNQCWLDPITPHLQHGDASWSVWLGTLQRSESGAGTKHVPASRTPIHPVIQDVSPRHICQQLLH